MNLNVGKSRCPGVIDRGGIICSVVGSSGLRTAFEGECTGGRGAGRGIDADICRPVHYGDFIAILPGNVISVDVIAR